MGTWQAIINITLFKISPNRRHLWIFNEWILIFLIPWWSFRIDTILTWSFIMPLRRTYKRLRTLYRTKVKLQSHLNFVMTYFDLDVIPRGLTIKKTPVVLGAGDMRRLLSIWEKTLHKTLHILLKHFKHYYRTTLLTTNSKKRQKNSDWEVERTLWRV